MMSTDGVLADLMLFNRVFVIVRLLVEINRIVFVINMHRNSLFIAIQ